jgi:YD repeat-containing protein
VTKKEVAGIDTGTRGTEYFDAFNSHRNTFIKTATTRYEVSASSDRVELADYHPAPLAAQPNSNVQTPQVESVEVYAALTALMLPRSSFAPLPDLTADQLVGISISYTYDPLNRLIAPDYSNGIYFHYTYDQVGNRLTQTTSLGTINHTYDSAREAPRSAA